MLNRSYGLQYEIKSFVVSKTKFVPKYDSKTNIRIQ